AEGALDEGAVTVARDRHAVVVVIAAAGYPATPRKGDVITGLEAAEAVEGVRVFHAGTALDGERVVSAGGRVLGVTAVGASAREAKDRAYRAVRLVELDGMHYRSDIAKSAV